jgi:hypothetical protein
MLAEVLSLSRPRLRSLVVLAVMAAMLAGCRLAPDILDGGLATELRVYATPTTIEVDAPGWFADVSAVFLCPTDPPRLPEPGPDRVGWTPGGECHDFGRFPSSDGLKVSLSRADLLATGSSAFSSAPDWTLLLLDVEGERVVGAIRSSFNAPIDAAAS